MNPARNLSLEVAELFSEFVPEYDQALALEFAKVGALRGAQPGECKHCGRPVDPGQCRCARCKERHNEYSRKARAAPREAGLCCRCKDSPAAAQSGRCESCEADHHLLVRSRYGSHPAGACSRCGRDRPNGFARCDRCREKQRRNDAAHRQREKAKRHVG